jgi:hypothetical protein
MKMSYLLAASAAMAWVASAAAAQEGVRSYRPQTGAIGPRTIQSSNALRVELRDEQADVVRVYDRARPEFDPLGVRVGTFVVRPGLELSEAYNDNIYADDTNEEEDFITMVRPSVRLESNWAQHALRFDANGGFGLYGSNDEENYDDWSFGTAGRFDITRGQYLVGRLRYDERHEDRGSPDDVFGIEPTRYALATANVGYVRDISILSLMTDFDVQQFNFKDVGSAIAPGATIDNDIRDRDQYQYRLRVGYEFIPNYEAFVEGTYNWRVYDQDNTFPGLAFAPTVRDRNRDSEGYSAVVGTAVNFSGKLRGDVSAGWMSQDYDSPVLEDIDAMKYGASLTWNITGLTSLIGEVNRSVEETVQGLASGYIASSYDLTLEHELRRNILLNANLGYDNNDYEGLNREDDIVYAGVGGDYLLMRGVSLTANYLFTDRDSNIAGADFSQNLFILGARFQM